MTIMTRSAGAVALEEPSNVASQPRPRMLTEGEVLRGFETPAKYLDVGHSQVAYYRFGDQGPDLVFVHGWPVSAATFRRVLPRLAREYRCHLVDLPGAGRTRCSDPRAIELLEHAKTVRRAVDALGLREYSFVAHDSGGFVARAAAADDPRVRALVLGGTEIPGHRPWVIQMYAMLAKLPFADAQVRAVMKLRAVRRSAIGFKGVFSDPDYAEGEFGELFVKPLLASTETAKETLALMKSVRFEIIDDLPAVHRRITAPVRLVWGTKDPFFPIDLARKMVAQFGGPAELVEIPGAKLFTQEDHPEQFASLTLEFLGRHLANRRAAV